MFVDYDVLEFVFVGFGVFVVGLVVVVKEVVV